MALHTRASVADTPRFEMKAFTMRAWLPLGVTLPDVNSSARYSSASHQKLSAARNVFWPILRVQENHTFFAYTELRCVSPRNRSPAFGLFLHLTPQLS